VIEWGDGVYGAEAAARTYFGRPAADLGPQESALLAGAIINPRLLDPGHPTARLRRRQQMIMRRMGAVTPPPVVAEVPPDPTGAPVLESVPTLPGAALPSEGPPVELPGQVLPPPKPLPPKPPGKASGAALPNR
jgi:hypothetical protein